MTQGKGIIHAVAGGAPSPHWPPRHPRPEPHGGDPAPAVAAQVVTAVRIEARRGWWPAAARPRHGDAGEHWRQGDGQSGRRSGVGCLPTTTRPRGVPPFLVNSWPQVGFAPPAARRPPPVTAVEAVEARGVAVELAPLTARIEWNRSLGEGERREGGVGWKLSPRVADLATPPRGGSVAVHRRRSPLSPPLAVAVAGGPWPLAERVEWAWKMLGARPLGGGGVGGG